MTCGIALQCAPSKDRIAELALDDLSPRERRRPVVVEVRVALGWVAARLAGPGPECERLLGQVDLADPDIDGARHRSPRRCGWPASPMPLVVDPLLGRLPHVALRRRGLRPRRCAGATGGCRGRRRRHASERIHSIPVGGDGGVRNPNLPPRAGPRTTRSRSGPTSGSGSRTPSGTCGPSGSSPTTSPCSSARSTARRSRADAGARRRCAAGSRSTPTGSMRNGLEDGSDLDIDRYVDHFVDASGRRDTPSRGCSATSSRASATSPPRCSSTAARRSARTAARSSSSNSPAPTRCPRR